MLILYTLLLIINIVHSALCKYTAHCTLYTITVHNILYIAYII